MPPIISGVALKLPMTAAVVAPALGIDAAQLGEHLAALAVHSPPAAVVIVSTPSGDGARHATFSVEKFLAVSLIEGRVFGAGEVAAVGGPFAGGGAGTDRCLK